MNPLLNPLTFYRVFKSYIADPPKLKKLNDNQIKRLQDKSLKKIIKYAYDIPLYNHKYKEANIKPDDIKNIADIQKLPVISKDDIRKFSPDGIIPSYYNKKNAIISRTGGTSGKPLPIYLDLYTVVKGMLGFVRALKEYGIDWKKTKMTLLIDLSERSFENEYFINSIFTAIKPLASQKNIQIFDLFESPYKIIEKINDFQPEFIGGYPYAITQLGILKNKGFGKNINPKCILSSGAFFNSYSRKETEEIFQTKTYDFYAATESGPIAFECKNGNYHIHSDLVYTELTKNTEIISPGETGNLIVTKLYGGGTPIIRYTGIDDVLTYNEDKCSCGLSGRILKTIHGRKNDSIFLPGGKIVFPSCMDNIIGETLFETRINYIERMQIVQNSLDKLTFKIMLNKQSKDAHSVENMFKLLKKKLLDRFEEKIVIDIFEVDEFKKDDPYLVSKVDRTKFIEKEYLI